MPKRTELKKRLIFADTDWHDPTISGIRSWWRERFGRDFWSDWEDAKGSEVAEGDGYRRFLNVKGVRYEVQLVPEGYRVLQLSNSYPDLLQGKRSGQWTIRHGDSLPAELCERVDRMRVPGRILFVEEFTMRNNKRYFIAWTEEEIPV
jgi:hypothetical protein